MLAPLVLLALSVTQGIAECVSPDDSAHPVSLRVVGRQSTGRWGESATEIAAWHPGSKRLFVVDAGRGLRVIDLSDPATPRQVQEIIAEGVTSVAVHGDLVAFVRQPKAKAERGTLELRTPALDPVASIQVGFGPDMVCFTPDGKRLLVANEGEADASGQPDPEGSIGVVDLAAGVARPSYRELRFGSFEARKSELAVRGLHCVSPKATLAQDLEPEYVAVAPDGARAFATLQENNAIAVIDLTPGRERVERIEPLGFKDFSKCGLDASDKDGGPNIKPWPVLGLYQPDTVKCFVHDGAVWLATANEGEERERGDVQEPVRVGQLRHALDPALSAKENLGRLKVSSLRGDDDGDGVFERLYCFGGRSVSLWKVESDGSISQVWDSGSQIEREMARRLPACFNADSKPGRTADTRSDAKGAEPEGIDIGVVSGRRLLFVGLERAGGVMSWDITDPADPSFVGWVNPRNPDADISADTDGDGKPDGPGAAGDLAPEGVLFVSATASPDGRPLLAVCNETSGTTTIVRVEPASAPAPKK